MTIAASHQLELTDDQVLATQRWQSDGVVYLVSGFLPGRGIVPGRHFYWATRGGFSVGGSEFEPYIRGPIRVTRGSTFQPGDGQEQPAIEVPVHNLPFAHSESLVAAVTDDDFAWEGAEATLRVGYLKPGQGPEDLAEADWTYLVKDGFLGAPRSVTADGFNMVVYNRGARRNQKMHLPRMAASGEAYAIDAKDASRMIPIVVGAPHGWVKIPTLNVGVRGYTVSAYDVGATVIQFRAITTGKERLLCGNWDNPGTPTLADEAAVSIRYRTPLYPIVTGSATYDEDSQIFTVTLASGLAAAITRGSLVQQHGPGRDDSDNSDDGGILNAFTWAVAAHGAYSTTSLALDGEPGEGAIGWLFADGTVRPADPNEWNVEFRESDLPGCKPFGAASGAAAGYVVALSRGTNANPKVPLYYTPGVSGEITQQPEFSTTAKERLTSKMNYPTGGSGTGNSSARDGSEETACSLGVGSYIELTFNSAPSPFDDEDTTASTLHAVTQGQIDFKNSIGSVIFGQASGAGGTNRQFRFTQSSARDYNETVRCIGAGGSGGSVVEVWWEHDLEADISLTRAQDVLLSQAGVSGAVGEIMEYAELVLRYPVKGSGQLARYVPSGSIDQLVQSPWARDMRDYYVGGTSNDVQACHPTAVMAGLTRLLGNSEANIRNINRASYDRAHQRFVDEDVRLNFALLDEPRSWTDLENRIASQVRAKMFYGPSGHEIHFLEATSGLEYVQPAQEFRLHGRPAADTLPTSGPLFERTPVSEVVNFVQGEFDYDHSVRRATHVLDAQNDESIQLNGVRKDTRGVLDMSLHSSVTMFSGGGAYDAAASVSGILRHYADRQAFSQTRFRFETAWVAAHVDRESIVRVLYATGQNTYRHSVCVVETITEEPLNSGRFVVSARAVLSPKKSFEKAVSWEDLFVESNDAWETKLTGPFDVWDDYWSIV